MKKVLFFILTIVFCITNFGDCARAEKLSVRITPTQVISTRNDEVEVGDWLEFVTIKDVYKNNFLFISKGSKIIGYVDFVHENGLIADNAQIVISKFQTRDINGKKVLIPYKIVLDRKNNTLVTFSDKIAQYIGFIFKGSEIYIEPDSQVINLFIISQ